MTISEILDQIYKKCEEEGIDLESLGIYDDEDLQIYALRFMYQHLEDLEEDIGMENDQDYLEENLEIVQ